MNKTCRKGYVVVLLVLALLLVLTGAQSPGDAGLRSIEVSKWCISKLNLAVKKLLVACRLIARTGHERLDRP
jgi:hypothetical protein